MDATQKLVDDILSNRVAINDLDLLQMEAVIDFMREHISEIAESAETEDEELYAQGLLTLVDLIEDAAERRFENQASGDWDKTIEESVSRGNTYFELENYVIQ
jgi:predicted nucleic acid-binding protein